MKNIKDDKLRRFVSAVFSKAGSTTHEADMIARRLVDSNLMGHDSHGVVRVTSYIGWLKEGKIKTNQHVKTLAESDAFAILDGQGGYGQVLGGEAMAIGIAKAKKTGVALVALRHAHHLGRAERFFVEFDRIGRAHLEDLIERIDVLMPQIGRHLDRLDARMR